jgi:hypothetical protein
VRVKIPSDPETTLKALFAMNPEDEPADPITLLAQ